MNQCINVFFFLRFDRINVLFPFSFFSESLSYENETFKKMYLNRDLVTSVKENIALSLEDERPVVPPRRLPPIPEDKLHRVR